MSFKTFAMPNLPKSPKSPSALNDGGKFPKIEGWDIHNFQANWLCVRDVRTQKSLKDVPKPTSLGSNLDTQLSEPTGKFTETFRVFQKKNTNRNPHCSSKLFVGRSSSGHLAQETKDTTTKNIGSRPWQTASYVDREAVGHGVGGSCKKIKPKMIEKQRPTKIVVNYWSVFLGVTILIYTSYMPHVITLESLGICPIIIHHWNIIRRLEHIYHIHLFQMQIGNKSCSMFCKRTMLYRARGTPAISVPGDKNKPPVVG